MTNSQLSQIHETLLTGLDNRFQDMQTAPSEGKIRSLKAMVVKSRDLVELLLESTASDAELLELQTLQQHLLEQLEQTVGEL